MQRLIVFLLFSVLFSLLYWTVVGLFIDRLSGWMPESAPLFGELRRYSWLFGVVLGVLTAGVVL